MKKNISYETVEVSNEKAEQIKDWLFELLLFLDSNNIKESQRRLKSEYDKIKRK